MSQPQPYWPSSPAPHPGNASERLAQADRVIDRERKQLQGIVERRKVTLICRYPRRNGDH